MGCEDTIFEGQGDSRGDKAFGRETLPSGGEILTYIVARKSIDEVSSGDRVSKHVPDSAQNLISKLRGLGRKRTREAVSKLAL